MANLGIVNLPDPNLSPFTQYNGIQIQVSLSNAGGGDTAIILMPYGTNFHPASLAFSSTTGLTVEYTLSPRPAIKAGTANWYVQSGITQFNAIKSQITGIRLTSTTNAIDAEFAI